MSDKQLSSVAKDLYRKAQEDEAKKNAADSGFAYANLTKTNIPVEVLSFLSQNEVIQNKAIPIKVDGQTLFLGMVDPARQDSQFFELLKKDYRFKQVQPVLISEPSYLDWLTKYKDIQKISARTDLQDKIDITKVPQIGSFEELAKKLLEAPIQEMLNYILSVGFAAKASDIHIEPRDETARIRLRLDGVLHEIATLTKERYQYVLSQVELHSGLKLNANHPQNGRFTIKIEEKELSVRIETVPSLHGDDIVLRLFNIEADLLNITQLGLSDYYLPVLKEALLRPHGMILVSGPTGSGKTSTIYAIINEINSEDVKIITLEDPVEYELNDVTQSQIDEGESFADRLKAVLREDPDIIMVGEIRDNAVAETALQAALTGHLLISSIHANDSVTSITRLVEMIGDPTLVTASTNLIIAQRLVRKICLACKEEYQPSPYEKSELQKILNAMPAAVKPKTQPKFYRGKGCNQCFGVGFSGRTGIFEILKLDNNMQKLIAQNASIYELEDAAKKGGLVTMEEDGIIKAMAGITTIGEVLKIIRE